MPYALAGRCLAPAKGNGLDYQRTQGNFGALLKGLQHLPNSDRRLEKALRHHSSWGRSLKHCQTLRPASAAAGSDIATSSQPGPPGAFTDGEEAAARQLLFNRIAPVYDQLNEALSMGQHRVWKRMAVKWSGAAPGGTVLDVCCGTGDLAFFLAEAVGPSGQVIGLDFAPEMLEDASRRADERSAEIGLPRRKRLPPMRWLQGDALALPLGDSEIDAATLGYGLRNVASIPQALRELQRVLKPGGKVAILDFNNSANPLVDGFQGWALDNLVVPMARSYGLAQEYEYLRPSIKAFPTGREQEALAKGAGFKKAVHYEIALGLMGVLVAQK